MGQAVQEEHHGTRRRYISPRSHKPHTQRHSSKTLTLSVAWSKFQVANSARIRWAGRVVRMGEKTNV